jgi:hypothetical protein
VSRLCLPLPTTSAWPTDEQGAALARLMRGRADSNVAIVREPFDLPAGYMLVTFVVGGFTCGISPEGDVSS